MLDSATFWAIFSGAQAIGRNAGPTHAHPHWYGDCVYCDCCNLIHAAGMDWLRAHA
jgi:hypothetical protein